MTANDQVQAPAAPSGASLSVWNPHTLARSAQLLADGQMSWPEGLSSHQADELRTETRRRCRARLVRFIAGRIATELINSSDQPAPSEAPHDQGHV